MDETYWWIIDIIAPAILLIVLVWLVLKRGSSRSPSKTERATDELYREEEKRRREGTDEAEE